MRHKLNIWLFNYDKTKGLSIGETGITSLFANENKNMLSEGNNQSFLDVFKDNDLWEKVDDGFIQNQAKSIGDVNQALVTYVQDAKAAGVASADLESNWIAQTSTATKFQGVLSNLGDVGGKALATLDDSLCHK